MGPFSLMIARYPNMNQEHPASSGYVINLMETLHNDRRVGKVHPFRLADTPITMSRNRCILRALEAKVDYVLMIDADMDPDCEPGAPPFWQTAWEFMMKRRAKEHGWEGKKDDMGADLKPTEMVPVATIAAPYCGPPPNESCYVFKWGTRTTGDAEPAFKLSMIDRDEASKKTGIEEVAALPTGLILYDTRVFRKLPPPWFCYEWKDGYQTEKASTEDVYQTRNASLMGMPQFCAWDCWAGHVKTKTVRKPQLMTIRAVRQEFADALLRGGHKAE